MNDILICLLLNLKNHGKIFKVDDINDEKLKIKLKSGKKMYTVTVTGYEVEE